MGLIAAADGIVGSYNTFLIIIEKNWNREDLNWFTIILLTLSSKYGFFFLSLSRFFDLLEDFSIFKSVKLSKYQSNYYLL